jgi:hypothetical protein
MSKLKIKRGALGAAALAAAAGLAACGGGADYTPPAADVAPVGDTFLNFIVGKAATMLDTEEAIVLDGITATMPEDTEPVAVSM